MNDRTTTAGKDVGRLTRLVLVIFMLSGFLLMVISLLLLYYHIWEYGRELFKELGVVLLAVSSVSLIYEFLLAEKHFEKFQALLRTEIERTDTNAATCARLGITRIFLTRDELERVLPLADTLSKVNLDAKVHIVAVSLFHIMNKAHLLQKALMTGAQVSLCMVGPDGAPNVVRRLPDLEVSDIQSAVNTFKKQFAEWVKVNKPAGRLELRYHDMPLLQSFAVFSIPNQKVGVWDLSFGRDTKDKRIFLVDPTMGLGADLAKRFDVVWKSATCVFLYEDGSLKTDAL